LNVTRVQEGANSKVEGRIRPLTAEDIPQVSRLHNKVWPVAKLSPSLLQDYHDYFSQVFLHNPWSGGPFCSLVHEESDGNITGFLGSLPRKMKMNGGPVQLRIASQFFVDPASRGFVGLRLTRAFLDGPQDISLTDEANSSARMIWERFGARICSFASLRWLAILRPCSFGLFASQKVGLLNGTLMRGLTPVARMIDALGSRVPVNPLRVVPPRLAGEPLDSDTLAACLTESAERKTLRPDYDKVTVEWLLHRASALRGSGSLRQVLVRTKSATAGWYVYYVNPRGLSEVVLLCARNECVNDVVEHLFYDAWQHGASVLIGRPDMDFLQSLSSRRCVLYSSPRQWMLVHSRRTELVDAFLREDAFFSRLDGEWCLHFR
jgi:hypothetical protein